MTVLANIKAEHLKARKERNQAKVTLLSTLLGEATIVGKNDGNRESTDGEVIKVIKKFMLNIKETLNHLWTNAKDGTVNEAEKLANEIQILKSFLPKQFSNDELSTVISNIITEIGATSLKDIGKIMKTLKEKYEGQYDGNDANSIIKQQF